MEKDQPLHVKRRGGTLLFCAGLLVGLWGLAQSPVLVEQYAESVGFQIGRALSVATGIVPISLAEIALLGVALFILIPAGLATRQVIRRQRGVSNAIAAGALRVASAAALIAAGFYLAWGLNYARAPLAERLGWPPIERPADDTEQRRQTDEIARLAQEVVEATNVNYRQFAGTDDLGHPSVRPAASPPIDATLDAAYARVQLRLGLDAAVGVPRGRAKPLVASMILNHLGLTGFYFPWTGEANYNRLEPDPDRPHTIAHEKAHQHGFAREDEASFIGYLACVMSDDPYARYSGYLFAQVQLLAELARRDNARARQLSLIARSPGVQRDLEAISAFWQQYVGTTTRVSAAINDRYLRSQGERRGIAAYAASRNLVVLFARHNGGSAVVAAPNGR